MTNLIVFWGEKSDSSFTWMSDGEGVQSENAHIDNPDSYHIRTSDLLKADLSCLADMLGDGSVTLVVSCKDIVAAQIEVPNKAQKLLRKAIPYILEDEIASPVDDLFFAFLHKDENGLLPVRAIAREYLENLIETFNKAELKLDRILVDIDLMSSLKEGMSVLIHHSECLIVESNNNRWNCFSDDFSWLIQKQLAKRQTGTLKDPATSEEIMPIAMPLDLYTTQSADKFIRNLPVGRFAVENHLLDNAQHFFAENLQKQNDKAIDLLQAEYEPKRENSQITNFLLRVASIFGVVLLTHVIYQSVQLYTLSDKKDQLEMQKLTLYKQAFPSRKTPSSAGRAVKSMRSYVKSLGGGSSEGGFLSLLSSSSEKLTDLTKIYPTNINYDSGRNELRMDVIATDLVVLDQYADELRKSGHKVSKSSETQTGDGYSSRLTINK